MRVAENEQELFKQVLIAASEKAGQDHMTVNEMITDISEMLIPIIKPDFE